MVLDALRRLFSSSSAHPDKTRRIEMRAHDLSAKEGGAEPVEVRGEEYRLPALEQVGSSLAVGETMEFMALLMPEPTNPHDPNAVQVWSLKDSVQLGYMAREQAEEYPDVSARLVETKSAAVCRATLYRLRDGWDVALHLLGPDACLDELDANEAAN